MKKNFKLFFLLISIFIVGGCVKTTVFDPQAYAKKNNPIEKIANQGFLTQLFSAPWYKKFVRDYGRKPNIAVVGSDVIPYPPKMMPTYGRLRSDPAMKFIPSSWFLCLDVYSINAIDQFYKIYGRPVPYLQKTPNGQVVGAYQVLSVAATKCLSSPQFGLMQNQVEAFRANQIDYFKKNGKLAIDLILESKKAHIIQVGKHQIVGYSTYRKLLNKRLSDQNFIRPDVVLVIKVNGEVLLNDATGQVVWVSD